ncbi:MAG: lipase family protein, partial [Oceanicaulis sp.]
DTFSVTVPLCSDSQAFIARIKPDYREDGLNDYLVIAFRGTEPRKLADIRTDVRARLTEAPGIQGTNARVHEGFYRALNDPAPDGMSIRGRIDAVLARPEHAGLPVFVTGHSLGGALAVVATRYIANGSRGACYTFGQPRVGNQDFHDQIFTPVYRVVNAADIVPAMPMGEAFTGALIDLVDRIPIPFLSKLAGLLRKIESYRHGGDQRFLFPAEAERATGQIVSYPGLKVISNPSLPDRWGSSFHRIVGSRGAVALGDHSISVYVEKLAAHALARRHLRQRLNAPGLQALNEAADAAAGAPAQSPAEPV